MTVDALRALGHDVKDIRGSSEQGIEDRDLWVTAVTGQRGLISTDKGFTVYRSVLHNGILIVRLRQPNRHKIHNAVMHVVSLFRDEEWLNLLVVVRDRTMSISRAGGERTQIESQ